MADNVRLFADCQNGRHGECLFQWPEGSVDNWVTCECECHRSPRLSGEAERLLREALSALPRTNVASNDFGAATAFAIASAAVNLHRIAGKEGDTKRGHDTFNQLRLAVGSLLDLVSELTVALEQGNRPDSAFVDTAVSVIKQHKREMGFNE